MDRGKEIFPQRNWLNRLINKVTSLKDPKYSGRGLDKVLTEMLGPLKLTDCLKPVFITTYDLNHNEAILFKKRKALGDAFCNALLKDICRATSAGPTYLPAYEFTYENKKRVCIDGGVYMNNPSVGAIVEASKYHEFYGFSEFDDITLLSLGTGHYTKDLVKKKVQGFGQLDWAVPISDVMMQGVNQTTCYMAEELLPAGQFLRLSVDIDEEKYSDMADSSDETRNYLVNKVNKDVIQNRAMMEKLDKFLGNNLA
jgi:patatin-like phospholipase/acyl hydrolase